tara:strand:- start:956 stop:1159 length:204 start_codon:yes stop_codon:yes gene_type:complete
MIAQFHAQEIQDDSRCLSLPRSCTFHDDIEGDANRKREKAQLHRSRLISDPQPSWFSQTKPELQNTG